MDQSRLEFMLKEQLQIEARGCEFSRDDTQTPCPRERLLSVFGRRLNQLKNMEDLSVSQQKVLLELKRFVGHLERLPNDQKLYFWKAESNGARWSGWRTDEKVIYAIPRKST